MSIHPTQFPAFDGLKVIAAFGIVWFHTPHAIGREIGYAGLVIFLLISFIILNTRPQSNTTYLKYLQQRGKRLLLPWVFWSIFYGLIAMRQSYSFHEFSLSGILTGTTIHLWYLPFAFLASFSVFTILKLTEKISTRLLVIIGTIVLILWLIVYPIFETMFTSSPWRQWNYGAASIPLGITLGQALKLPPKQRYEIMLTIAIMMVILSVYLAQMNQFGTGVSYMIGTIFVIIALSVTIPSSAFVTKLSALTFGIYLLHPLVFMICYKLYGGNISAGTLMVSGFFGAGILTAILRQFSWGRQIL
jgi:peptidoglycan/LPS O-acetylase OafA/YrhL